MTSRTGFWGALERLRRSSSAQQKDRARGSVLRRTLRTRRGRAGIAMSSLVIAVAFIGPIIPGLQPNAIALTPFAKPSAGHVLGGDVLGRDVLDRALSGGWLLLIMALCATALGGVPGDCGRGGCGVSCRLARRFHNENCGCDSCHPKYCVCSTLG